MQDELASGDYSTRAGRLTSAMRGELEQAEHLLQTVRDGLKPAMMDAGADLALYQSQFQQIGHAFIDFVHQVEEDPDPQTLEAVIALANDQVANLDFLREELVQAEQKAELVQPYLDLYQRLIRLCEQALTNDIDIAEAMDGLEQRMKACLNGEIEDAPPTMDKEELIQILESAATMVLESEVTEDYKVLLYSAQKQAVLLGDSYAILATRFDELQHEEQARLDAELDRIKESLKNLIWSIDTESAVSESRSQLDQIEQEISAHHNGTIEALGSTVRHAILELEEALSTEAESASSLSDYDEASDQAQQEPSYSEYASDTEAHQAYATESSSSSTPPSTPSTTDLNEPAMNDFNASESTAMLEELDRKLSSLEERIQSKADRSEVREIMARQTEGGNPEEMQAELDRLRRRMSDLEELAASPGDINENLLKKQISSLASELSVMDKQTRMLLTDLNAKVESAVLKQDLNSRLRDFSSRDQLREVENMLRDRQNEVRAEVKVLQEELGKRASVDQLRKEAREVFREERQSEQLVERFELKTVETAVDQLSERLSRKLDSESLAERMQDFVTKESLQNELKLLEMHKNETRLFLSDMQEKIKTIPDYDGLVGTFVKQRDFDEMVQKRGKALGEMRLDIGVALEKAEKAVSPEALKEALEELKNSIPQSQVFEGIAQDIQGLKTDLAAQVQQLNTKLAEYPTTEEMDQLAKVVNAHTEHLARVPEEDAVDLMIRAKVQELEAKSASREESDTLRQQVSLLETDLQSIRVHHESLQEVLKVIQTDIQDLDINKESFIQNFNDELKESLFKMISQYDASLQHDLEDKLNKWKAYQESLKQEQLDAVLKFLNEEVYKASTDFKDRLERNVSEQISGHNEKFRLARQDMEQVNAEKKALLEDLRRAKADLSDLEYLKKESVREFREELRRAKAEIFDHSETGMRQYYDEQLEKLRRSYEEKNEQILDLLSESRGDWFSQNLLGIIAVIMAGVAIALGINSLL